MSGIYGLFARDGAPAAPQAMESMRDAMAFWGPDGAGCYCDGRIGIGHLMLHTTAESQHERLPAAHPRRPDLWITADARIDNRVELCAALRVDASQHADSTLILLAYARWGEECVPKLLGDFAFVIWDGQRQAIFCARDYIGCKPFYYHLTSRLFAFASDLRGLLAHPSVQHRVNEPLLALYLQEFSHFAEKRLTFLEEIVKLPPAHWMIVTADGVRLQEYWSVGDVAPLNLASDAEYEERLRELLTEAVACRLRTPSRVGAHLSGGLDSTAVAVLAARGLREQGRDLAGAFSWSPPPAAAEGEDERQKIIEVCAAERIDCHFVEWGMEHGVEVYRLDFTVQPREMLLRELKVQQAARQENIRVLLSGWGGDEAISGPGRGYLAELLRSGRWRTFVREVGAVYRADPVPGMRKLKRYAGILYARVLQPFIPDTLWPLFLRLTGRPLSDPRFVSRSFARRYRKDVAGLRGPLLRERPGLHRNQRRWLGNGHLTGRIESWALSGAQHGVEYRYPLLDRRIVEFALGVPANQLFRDGWGRYLFRRSLHGILPERMRWQRSKSEPAAFGRVLTVLPEVLPLLLDEPGSASARRHAAAYIDIAALEKEVHRRKPMSGDWVMLERALSCLRIGYPAGAPADVIAGQ